MNKTPIQNGTPAQVIELIKKSTEVWAVGMLKLDKPVVVEYVASGPKFIKWLKTMLPESEIEYCHTIPDATHPNIALVINVVNPVSKPRPYVLIGRVRSFNGHIYRLRGEAKQLRRSMNVKELIAAIPQFVEQYEEIRISHKGEAVCWWHDTATISAWTRQVTEAMYAQLPNHKLGRRNPYTCADYARVHS